MEKGITVEKLEELLELHELWLEDNEKGKRLDLSNKDLTNPKVLKLLRNANLENANLENANLYGANLEYANLRYTNLRYANLKNASLKYARLKYANFEFTNLYGAILKYAYFNK